MKCFFSFCLEAPEIWCFTQWTLTDFREDAVCVGHHAKMHSILDTWMIDGQMPVESQCHAIETQEQSQSA